ncbi:MAG TPA: uracil-DNA glycosylase [Candidatus Elarobacter sp.]|nr:uracil-DNA glycosylase [Candidatus Elarobacter sp.]
MSVEDAMRALDKLRTAPRARTAEEQVPRRRSTPAAAASAPPVEPVQRREPVPLPEQPTKPPPGPAAPAPDVRVSAADSDAGDDMKAITQGLVVGTPNGSLFEENPFSAVRSLGALAKLIEECTRCPLYKTATHGVPGEGDPKADLMCVGEAPGANEDETGKPFVGQAGALLTKILAAIDLKREDVFIANVLKHRPPGNRNPKPDEIEACSPYLIRQVQLVKPKVILALGTFAAQTLLDTKTPIGKLRGAVHRYYGIPLVVTYHPAALLRNPAWKRPTWEDVKLARRVLDSETS